MKRWNSNQLSYHTRAVGRDFRNCQVDEVEGAGERGGEGRGERGEGEGGRGRDRLKQVVEEVSGWRLKRHLYHRELEKNSKVINKAKREPGWYATIHSLTEYCLLFAWYFNYGDTKMIQKLYLSVRKSGCSEGEKQVNKKLTTKYDKCYNESIHTVFCRREEAATKTVLAQGWVKVGVAGWRGLQWLERGRSDRKTTSRSLGPREVANHFI